MPGPEQCITPLFVPGDQPNRFSKALRSDADAVIVDLEDAVANESKAPARQAALWRSHGNEKPIIVRVNGVQSEHHAADLAAVLAHAPDMVILPKAESLIDVSRVRCALPDRTGLILLIETASGLAASRELARSSGVARLAFGSVDLAVDLGCAHERDALAAARSEVVLASRLAALPAPLDGVTLNVKDEAMVAQDACHARDMGFGGKMCIHPAQLAPVRAAFRPSEADLAWAQRVLAVDRGGARMMDGAMIDEPVVRRARQVLERSGERRRMHEKAD